MEERREGVKRKTKGLAAILLMLALCLTLTGGVSWAADGDGAVKEALHYWYDLEIDPGDQPADSAHTWVKLWVLADVDENGDHWPALHTGSVALGVETGGNLYGDADFCFLPETGYSTTTFQAAEDDAESGFTGGESYVGFNWYSSFGEELEQDASGRQLLGRLQLPFGNNGSQGEELKENILILPFRQTVTGSRLEGEIPTASPEVQEELREIIVNTWRSIREDNKDLGYYQGFYLNEEGMQNRVDIGCRWRANLLRVVSYDPKDALQIKLYPRQEDGSYGAAPRYILTLAGTAVGQGQTSVSVPFADSTYADTEAGMEIQANALPEGTYRLEIVKQSHVRAVCSGVTVAGEELFPEIAGQRIVLPCGDVDGNGHIGQQDRGVLTARGRYGHKAAEKTAERPEGEPYDLDGDGLVNQKDLAILIAASNYGKNDLIFTFGDDGK